MRSCTTRCEAEEAGACAADAGPNPHTHSAAKAKPQTILLGKLIAQALYNLIARAGAKCGQNREAVLRRTPTRHLPRTNDSARLAYDGLCGASAISFNWNTA